MFRRTILVVRIVGVFVAAAVAFSLQLRFAQADDTAPSDGSAKPGIIRIKAGDDKDFKDSKGNVWLADKMTKDGGIEGGETIDRPDDMKIENTGDYDPG